MQWTFDELITRIVALPPHIRTRIICMVIWKLFGNEAGEKLSVDMDSKPTPSYVKDVVAYLREQVAMERPAVTIEEVLRAGKMKISPGDTVVAVKEQADERLDTAAAPDICGEIVFRGSDDCYYVGEVEFVVAPDNPAAVAARLGVPLNTLKDDKEE